MGSELDLTPDFGEVKVFLCLRMQTSPGLPHETHSFLDEQEEMWFIASGQCWKFLKFF